MVDWNKPVQVKYGEKWHDAVNVVVGRLRVGYAAVIWYDDNNCICADTYSCESTLVRNTLTPPAPVLKACPFCGRSNTEIVDDGATNATLRMYFARCKHCAGKTGGRSSFSDAIAAWNRRAE
jgi:Lar family restriction alleviation protein